MWKYLKDYLIGKLLDKWILQTDLNLNSTKDSFLHYTNIDINPETFTKSLQNTFNSLELTCGTVEELTVEINWTEIFRYWTEIKSKYHVDDEFQDSESDDEMCSSESCSIKIKNLRLDLKANISDICDIEPCDLSASDIDLEDESNPDLIKDFLDHIIGQFKVEIDGILINIDETSSIEIPGLLITPEINGIRKISIFENSNIKHFDADLQIKKETEVILMRTIEDYKVKVNIPEIKLEAGNLKFLKLQPFMEFKTRIHEGSPNALSFEITLNLIKVNLAKHLNISVHDIYVDDSGAFIVGHFESSWKDRKLFLESPVQTHVITGNYKRKFAEIDEEIILRVTEINELNEVFSILAAETQTESARDPMQFSLKIKALKAAIEEYNVKLSDVFYNRTEIFIDSINLNKNNNVLDFNNVSYTKNKKDSLNESICPFAEMKKFIENDEIVSIETEDDLYSKCFDFDKFTIESVKGELNLNELKNSRGSGDNGKFGVFLMGNVNHIDLTLKLPEIDYNLQLNNLRVLINENFIDLRVQLNNLMRQSTVLISETGITLVLTNPLNVVEIDGMNLVIPHDVFDLIISDMHSIELFEASSGNNSNFIQASVKELKMELRHFELDSPVKSNLFARELCYKNNSVYLDDFKILINDENVFKSGLLRFDMSNKVLTNHCSYLTLTPESFKDLVKCVQFWSDIYTPVIEEIPPEAIFADRGTSDFEEDEMSFEFELSEELELETETIENENVLETEKIENDTISDYHKTTEHFTCDLTELLNDIDDDFFVKKDHIVTDSHVLFKISDCGFRINLSDPNSSVNVTINLSGIDATISSDGISLKVKEGKAFNDEKLIVSKWPRGPDVTCKYPIEDGNFLSIKSENNPKNSENDHSGIDEVNLKISISPLRLFFDQNLLNFLVNFFGVNNNLNKLSDAKMKAFVFFKKVNISPLIIKLDYKVNGSSTLPCLKGAEITLPRIELRGIKGLEGLAPAILAAWIPEVKGNKLTGVLTTGLVPVRTIVNLGGGVVELILLPWQIKGDVSAAQTVAQIRKSGRQIGLETLKLTTSIANNTSTLLLGKSDSAEKPRDFQTGVQQAAQLIIALPARLQSNKGGGVLKAVPLFILDSAATATGALAKTLQGIQAEFEEQ